MWTPINTGQNPNWGNAVGPNASTILYYPAGTGAVVTNVQDKLRETVSVKDFGAVGDGVIDDKPAIQIAINYLMANNGASLYFPDGIYYLATPVTINFDAQNTMRLHGSSTSNYFGFDTGGARITGAVGMESMFILTKTNLATAGGYGFECDHIFFKSASVGMAGPLTAIKNKIGGAPARPFVIANCGFIGFDKAIVSEIPAGGATTTGICQVTIRESTFVANNYALYGSGNIGPIMNLLFIGNASENGGKIYSNQHGGTFAITDNLLEGQADAIEINCGFAAGEIARNYFELNSGYLMKVTATNPNTQCRVHSNYMLNSAGSKAYFQNMRLDCSEDFKINGILFDVQSSAGKSKINNEGVLNPALWLNGNYRFDINSVPRQTSVPPGTLTGGGWLSGGGIAAVTPIGTVDVATLASGPGAWMSPGLISLNANDAVVAMAIARRTIGEPFLYLAVYDNAYGYLANSDTSQPIKFTSVGEWVFVMAIVKVPSGSGGTPRIRWVTVNGTADVSATYFYKVATPVNNSTEAYYCLLNQ
jgi:hypothetical protein